MARPRGDVVSVHSIAELIVHAGQNPGKVNFASPGVGTVNHLAAEMFARAAKVKLMAIPYKGSNGLNTDLIAGQTQAMFPGLAAALPHIRSGRARPLAVTGPQRHPQLKDTPTLEELGFKGFDAVQWYGVVGPAGMPAPIVKLLNDTLKSVLSAPDLRDKLSVEAIEPQPMTPDTFAQYIRNDLERWSRLAKARNIQLDS